MIKCIKVLIQNYLQFCCDILLLFLGCSPLTAYSHQQCLTLVSCSCRKQELQYYYDSMLGDIKNCLNQIRLAI